MLLPSLAAAAFTPGYRPRAPPARAPATDLPAVFLMAGRSVASVPEFPCIPSVLEACALLAARCNVSKASHWQLPSVL